MSRRDLDRPAMTALLAALRKARTSVVEENLTKGVPALDDSGGGMPRTGRRKRGLMKPERAGSCPRTVLVG